MIRGIAKEFDVRGSMVRLQKDFAKCCHGMNGMNRVKVAFCPGFIYGFCVEDTKSEWAVVYGG